MSKALPCSFAFLVLFALVYIADGKKDWPHGQYTCRYSSSKFAHYDTPCGRAQMYCPIDDQPFNATCWSEREQKPFFTVIAVEAYTSPWQRATSEVDCGSGECDRTMTFTKTMMTTDTSGIATTNSSSSSKTDTNTQTMTDEVKNTISAGIEGIVEDSAEFSFKYETKDEHSTSSTNKTALTKSYSFALGKSFSVSDAVRCKAQAGETLSLEMRTYASIIKGNRCKKLPYKLIDPYYRYECEYMEITCPAVLPSGALDVSVRCVRQIIDNIF